MTLLTLHPTSDRPVPALTPEMTAAAEAVVATEWLDLRQYPGAECGILMRTPAEVVTAWVLRGVEHDYWEATRQLRMARLGEGKWKEMQLDLQGRPGALVYPLDYCPEISREEVAWLKTDEGLAGLETLPCWKMTKSLADMLCLGEAEFFMECGIETVEQTLALLAVRIADLTKVRAALQAARLGLWPGTTQAEWDAHRAAERQIVATAGSGSAIPSLRPA